MRSGRTKLLLMLVAGFVAPSCDPRPPHVVVLGDSHSDADRVPPADWIAFAPPSWVVVEHAMHGQECAEAIPIVFDPEALVGSDSLVIFCGSNDAGEPVWDLGVTAGWIETGILEGLAQGLEVVVVAPPPAFFDFPVNHTLRNDRLADLRAEIFDLALAHGAVVADLWDEVWAHEQPESLFVDGLHLDPVGRALAAGVIADAVASANGS